MLFRHLDSPVRILSFSINDLIGYFAPFFVGAFFDSLLIIPMGGLLLVYIVKRLLRHVSRFYVIRYMYWALPTRRYNKLVRISWPASSKRLWVK